MSGSRETYTYGFRHAGSFDELLPHRILSCKLNVHRDHLRAGD